MARPPKEFHAFTSLVDKLLGVPKSELDRRVAAHKAESDKNPRKRGPKPLKRRASVSRASGGKG